jgi:hypothetical protein
MAMAPQAKQVASAAWRRVSGHDSTMCVAVDTPW